MYDEIRRDRSWLSISLPLHHPSTFEYSLYDKVLDEYILAELVHRAITKFCPGEPVHMAGYSVGGFAAMNYAAKYPGQVRSIISIGGFLTGRAQGIEGVLQFLAKGTYLRKAVFYVAYRGMQLHRFFFKLATMAYARKWRELLAYPALDPTIKDIFPDVRRHSVRGQRAWFSYLLDMNLLDELTAIKHPTLVIAGDADPIIPYAHQAEVASLLPNGRLLRLRGVGHVAFAEAAAEFKAAVLKHLSQFDEDLV